MAFGRGGRLDQSNAGESPMLAAFTPVVEGLKAINATLVQNQKDLLSALSASANYDTGPAGEAAAQAQQHAMSTAGQTVAPVNHTPGTAAPSPVPQPAPRGVGVGSGVPQPAARPYPGYPGGPGQGGGGGGQGGSGFGVQSGVANGLQVGQELWGLLGRTQARARRYQAIQAGSRGEGLREVAREEMYALEQALRDPLKNVWTEGEARQAFVDATNMGFHDRADGSQTSRAEALNFMRFQASPEGNGLDQHASASLLRTTITNANHNLSELSNAITNVGDAAAEAGVNAEVAYSNLQNYLGSMVRTLGGTGTERLAGSIAAGQANMGKAFQHADFGSMVTDRGRRAMAASIGGMTPGQFQTDLRNGGSRALGVLSQISQRAVTNLIPSDQQQFIRDLVARAGGREMILKDESLAARIGDEWASRFNVDLDVLHDGLRGQGSIPDNLDVAALPAWVVSNVMGVNPMSGDVYRAGSGRQVNASGTAYADGGGAVTGKDAEVLRQGTALGVAPGSRGSGGKDANNGGTRAYEALSARRGGAREPIIEALLARVPDPDNTMVKVHAHGGARVMSVSEAIANFPDSVVAGKIEFMKGQGLNKDGDKVDLAGVSFTDATGMSGAANRSSFNESIDPRLAGVGTAADEWEKKHGTKDDNPLKTALSASEKAGEAFKLELTQDAKRLVKLLDSGGSKTSDDAASGERPTPTGNRSWKDRLDWKGGW